MSPTSLHPSDDGESTSNSLMGLLKSPKTLVPIPTLARLNATGAIHWRVPAVMIGSFCLGVILAGSNHLFYSLLNSQVVKSTVEQQLYGAMGSAFAFAVKMFLITAIGMAFVQVFWKTLRTQAMTLKSIDVMFLVLSDPSQFLYIHVWLRHPCLVALAILSWLVPLVAVFSPSSLTVHLAPDLRRSTMMAAVPKLDFTKPTFATINPNLTHIVSEYYGSSGFIGPSYLLTRLGLASALQGSVLPMPPPFINSTYSLEFTGPAVKCEKLAQSPWDFGLEKTFVSWVPAPKDDLAYKSALRGAGLTLDATPEVMQIFAAVLPSKNPTTWTVINCTLYNATYDVDFRFQDGSQIVNTSIREYTHGVGKMGSLSNPYNGPEVFAYESLMSALGAIMVGFINDSYTMQTWLPITTLVNTEDMESFFVKDLGEAVYVSFGPATKPLAEGIEEMFQNMTLSLLSAEDFRLDYAANPSVPLTSITTFTSKTIYHYTPLRLLLFNGIVILLSLIGLIAGCLAISSNGASYINAFSTVARATRNMELDDLLSQEDRSGAEPLPSGLARANVQIGRDLKSRKSEGGSGSEADIGRSDMMDTLVAVDVDVENEKGNVFLDSTLMVESPQRLVGSGLEMRREEKGAEESNEEMRPRH